MTDVLACRCCGRPFAEEEAERLLEFLEKKVSEWPLDEYPCNAAGRTTYEKLALQGFRTIGDVQEASDADLLNVRGVGYATLDGLRGDANLVRDWLMQRQYLGLCWIRDAE